MFQFLDATRLLVVKLRLLGVNRTAQDAVCKAGVEGKAKFQKEMRKIKYTYLPT